MKQIYRFVHQQARDNASRACQEAPEGWVCTIQEPTRNLEQNARLHAVLSEIAESRDWHGERLDIDTWKRLLTAAWFRARGEQVAMYKSLDGIGIDVIPRRTRDLTKPEFSELIDYIESWQHSA